MGEARLAVLCKVLPGMFAGERLAIIEDSAGKRIASLLVDASLVKTETEPKKDVPVLGRVAVLPLHGSEQVTVELPVQSMESGFVISVPSAKLALF